MEYDYNKYHRAVKTLPTSNGYNTSTVVPNDLADILDEMPPQSWHSVNIITGMMGCVGRTFCKIEHGSVH